MVEQVQTQKQETISQESEIEVGCRYFNRVDDGCPNLDGSFDNKDICPLDGEGCVSGLGTENLEERTQFPTRITGTYTEKELIEALDGVRDAMGEETLTPLSKSILKQAGKKGNASLR